jgi:steroid delta-isomerase
MDTDHPAARTALAAMRAVTDGERDAWLACYAEDAVLYDPVGGSPIDPHGTGIRGHGALGQFWDLVVAPNDVRFDVAAVHPGGLEVAVVATVTSVSPNQPTVSYDGVFVYRLTDDGRIATMHGYWDIQRVRTERATQADPGRL